MEIKSPSYAQALEVLRALEQAGHDCRFVGGCVRDALIGAADPDEASDIDLAASATPEQMTEVFAKYGWAALPTGVKHGTVTARVNGASVEVTTFRSDGDYSDGRRPDSVTFTKDIEADLSRRDFTVNAMAWHPERGLLDPHGGREDIEKKLIRAVGDPGRRFGEDALRMLRAVRFAGRLGFAVGDGTWEAIRANAGLIAKVSHERCAAEIMSIVCSPEPGDAMRLMYGSGLMKYLLPEIDDLFDPVTGAQNVPYLPETVGEQTLTVMSGLPPEPILRLAALLQDVGKPICRGTRPGGGHDTFYGHPEESARIAPAILSRLNIPNRQADRIVPLILYHDTMPAPDAYSLKHLLFRVSNGTDAEAGAVFFKDWIRLKRSGIFGQDPEVHSEKLASLNKFEHLYECVIGEGQAYVLSQLAINGGDITALGITGPLVGHILDTCLRLVIRDPDENTRKKLMRLASSYMEKDRRSFPLRRK